MVEVSNTSEVAEQADMQVAISNHLEGLEKAAMLLLVRIMRG